MIIDDYLEYSKTYKTKYGDKCIVLMQVGSFYELYSITDDTSHDIYVIADLCNIQISRKNKSITEVSITNPLMAGFPLYTLQKYTQILLNNNFTIVLIEQVTEPPNPERKVTEILSPGMNISLNTKSSNYMMVLYFEFINKHLVAGISGIDLSTGKTFIYEAGSTKQDPEFANDEVFRLINTYNPTEVIIISDNIYDYEKSYILKNLNINNILVHYKWDKYEYIDIMKKIVFQNGILEKAFFSKKSLLSIIEVLNLEKYDIARISFCCLLQFAYEHNADIIQELHTPEVFESNQYLTIEYNSALQLNILGLYQGDKPLLNILNRCNTAFGSRAFKEKLLTPIVNADKLIQTYNDIDSLLINQKYKEVCNKLKGIIDLERIKRKMIIQKMHPLEWSAFNVSMHNAREIYCFLNDFKGELSVIDINNIISAYEKVIDLDEASKYNLQDKSSMGNFFLEGVYEDIDELVHKYNESYSQLQKIADDINHLGQNDNTLCKLESNDREGYYISITKKRFETALGINKVFMSIFEKKILGASNNYKLTNDEMAQHSHNINYYNQLISSNVFQKYQEFIKQFVNQYGDNIDRVISYLTKIDILCCCAKNASDYKYIRPRINKESSCSYLCAQNLRHPIIEQIDDSVEYIGNNIHISENGILLYGINASGKSSFMKAIGLNIIMAQAGMFVACDDLEFSPYHHIFTRISGMDNIFKGMSSFTVEMTELRNILQRCNKNSLVIGDEICCGTESVSALAIVASGIDTLVKKKSSFIFATHLHELTKLKLIKKYVSGKSVGIYHMHIHIDDQNRIVYDRKLQEGQGSEVYGIEVCKSLDLPKDFMKIAEETRKEVQELQNTIIKTKRSVYNAKVIIDKCGVCGDSAIDTHHIKYQSTANEEGFIGSFHKNKKHNLVPLCKNCHKKEHDNELKIEGYVKTSDGIILKYH
jgi:DNA mismatch repair protein MutS